MYQKTNLLTLKIESNYIINLLNIINNITPLIQEGKFNKKKSFTI